MLSEPERFTEDERAKKTPLLDKELGVALGPALLDDGYSLDIDVAKPEVPLESDLWLLVEPVYLAGESSTAATRCFLASRRSFMRADYISVTVQ